MSFTKREGSSSPLLSALFYMHQLKDHMIFGSAEPYQCVVFLILSGSQISVLLNSKIDFLKDIY